MRRGRSERRDVALGSEGWKGSDGHANLESDVSAKVGLVNAAVFVCHGAINLRDHSQKMMETQHTVEG